jgi:Uma2 family endonuclease
MAVSTHRAVFTYDHLLDLREKVDDGQRYEVIDGELVVSPAPGFAHQYASTALVTELNNHVRPRGLGIILHAPFDVIFSKLNVVQPDLVCLTAEQVQRVRERGVEEAPTLVVEILSPSTSARDRREKLQLYARMGVPHYWLLHPRRRYLDAHELREGRYVLVAHLEGDAEFRPALFPGLVLRLAQIWAPRTAGRAE